jgi:DNA (cytosine-5)-methyltransferase 3A
MLYAFGLKIKMQVLSLFDGMSCGQLALRQLGIPIEKYYASEIDKYAIAVTQANFPNTIQVGDVCALDPKDFADVDLIIGGSPCQGFSFAGKKLAFDDPRSKLFFEFVRLVKAIQPKYFLLENVRMKKEWLAIISEQLGVEGICINSALVSAQNRVRYYWTNIPNITQPTDQGILLKDILEIDAEEPMYSNIYGGFGEKKPRTHFSKSVTIRANSGGGAIPSVSIKPVKDTERNRRHYRKRNQKALCMTASMHKGAGNNGMTLVPYKPVHNKINQAKVDNMQPGDIAATQINNSKNFGNAVNVDGKAFTLRASNPNGVVSRVKNKSKTVSDATQDSVVVEKLPNKAAVLKANYYKSSKANFENDTSKGGKFTATGVPLKSKIRDKSKTVRTGGRLSYDRHEWDSVDELHYRKLTPLECMRLQTVPDDYKMPVSNTQKYKLLGNGFTVAVIQHIFSHMEAT